MTILYIILGIIVVLVIAFKIWMWSIEVMEVKRTNKLVSELSRNKTPKLTKHQQLQFLSGELGWEILQNILDKKEIEVAVLNYFIDIEPDEYWEHLKQNHPPNNIQRDMYENMIVKNDNEYYELEFLDHGKKMSSLKFDNYDNMLKFLVFDTLTNSAPKRYKNLNKEYYTQHCV
tara:strand:+ start:320 stop:841 length:522 start_codon:yes stop_codon:yes gene_type:complete